MVATNTIELCRFCAEISKSNGEDPIGSAGKYNRFLLIEAPLPWSEQIWLKAGSMPQGIIDAFQVAWDRDIKFRPLAIAPDQNTNAKIESIHVLYFSRPAVQFAMFERQEYLIPQGELSQFPRVNSPTW